MNGWRGLDRVDRVTLRVWRASNLVGWWLMGAVAYNGLMFLLSRTLLQKIAYGSVKGLPMISLVLVFGFSATTAGWIVGSRVYRWPGLVGLLTVLLPGGLLLLQLVANGSIAESAYSALFVVVPAVVAGLTSRVVWRRRPRALRAA
jgi:hypothetical protein